EELGSFPQRANNRKSLPLATRLLQREIGTYRGERARIGSQLLAQSVIPSTKADFVMRHNSNVYSGQFSTDGNFFYSCSQDFKVRMYDTSNPYNWEHYKTARYEGGRWTITDATLSPDNKMLAYSSITPVVYVSNTQPGAEGTWAMDFCASRRQTRSIIERDFGIWSIRFSGDGRELVAGASDCNLYIYDIETQTTVLKLTGHKDEVNAVCFADVDSPHILYSGSDDTTLKVWDRRSMGSGREAGVFAGHMEGLTYIDSKGDGRYVLSNGKDQTMKLWDIRKMMEPSAFDNLRHQNYQCGFDYRMQQYPRRRGGRRHPQDCSVVTYSGHKVLRTLIRCHFSPPVSSGSRYVYTGSADGQVWIYNLDATTKAVIDVQGAVSSAYGFQRHGGGCVRDASWHPNAGVIAATSWKGMNHDGGNISLHSFNGGGMSDKEVVQLNASEDSSYYSGWAYY
ncbi:WD40-repeat-containing domain protein, partial [Peziza echinospora]